MLYIVIDNESKEAYKVSDVSAIGRLIRKSTNTIHNWFRKDKTYHRWGVYEIYKGVKEVKSKRRNLNNLKPFSGLS